MYRIKDKLELFLVHPGGPYFINKDSGSWTIPKGEFENEEPLLAALREFHEETSITLSDSENYRALTPVKQKGGKWIYAFAIMGDVDPGSIKSNEFCIEWPPRSGMTRSFPEIDQGGWFDIETAKIKINPAQAGLILELVSILNIPG